MTWLWIPILVIWFMMAINGYRRGFLKIIISFFLSVILILTLSPVIEENLLEKTPMLQQIEEIFLNVVTSAFGAEADTSYNGQIEFINSLPMLPYLKENLIENNNNVIYQMLSATTFIEYVAGYLARFLMKIISFILALLAANILLKILDEIMDVFEKLPIIGVLNNLGGLLLGVGKGFIYLWIFFAILSVFSHTTPGAYLINEISGDVHLNYLYENNLLIQYLVSMIIQ